MSEELKIALLHIIPADSREIMVYNLVSFENIPALLHAITILLPIFL
jgi:hypothetical protein